MIDKQTVKDVVFEAIDEYDSGKIKMSLNSYIQSKIDAIPDRPFIDLEREESLIKRGKVTIVRIQRDYDDVKNFPPYSFIMSNKKEDCFWVSVKEKKPDSDDEILFCGFDGTTYCGCYDTKKHHWIAENLYDTLFNDDEVIAWRNLPEPYDVDRDENYTITIPDSEGNGNDE